MGVDILYPGEKVEKKRKRYSKERFFSDFSVELDIFDSETSFPDWVMRYREEILNKIDPEMKKICCYLKDHGLAFKIKWPIEIDGKWKFADIYIPGQNLVITKSNPMINTRPGGLPSYRAEFFKRKYAIVDIESLEELRCKVETFKAIKF